MKRMISGIKPTGKITIGNFLGAIKQFIKNQDEYELLVFIADLHALTLPIDPKELRQNIIDLVCIYLACGLDPKKCKIFRQSEVIGHNDLSWVLTCNTTLGELTKMPQYKNYIAEHGDKGIPSGNNLTKKLPTEKQLNDMEEKIMWKKDVPVRNRNIAIFRVLRGTGIRESELAGLDLSDLHLDEEMPYITILGKGVYREMQNRTVYLSGSALKAIREWLEYRSTLDNIVDTEAVFINKNGTRTTERNIKQIFENYGNGITPHMMRHYYASVMNQNGNLAFVQQQLGHSSVNTTVNNYANGAVGMKEKLMEM